MERRDAMSYLGGVDKMMPKMQEPELKHKRGERWPWLPKRKKMKKYIEKCKLFFRAKKVCVSDRKGMCFEK